MNPLQTCIHSIFKEFDRVCTEHDLRYFAAGGTAIGAVRHKGFIPWDDDLDVCMPRPDYERFMEIGQSLLPDYLFLANNRTEPDLRYPYAKIYDTRTTYIESSAVNLKIHHCVFMDIFPIDGFPTDIKEKKRIWEKAQWAFAYAGKDFKVKRSLKGKLALPLAKMRFSGKTPQEVLLDLIELYKQYPYEGAKNCVMECPWWKEPEFDPSWIGKGKRIPFEDGSIMVFDDVDAYLRSIYGDYMTPPPEEKRVGHHYADVIDLDKPYTEYIGK